MKKYLLIIGIALSLLCIGLFFTNKSTPVDKGGLWLEMAIRETQENQDLNKQQKEKITDHLNTLLKDKDLRLDTQGQEDFLREVKNLNYPDTAILSLEKAHVRVSSPLNYHDGYWVAKIKPPGSPFKVSVINDMHVDAYSKRITVYAQSRLFGKTLTPAQVGPGEYATDKDGKKIAHHPNSVYLNGSGQELSESDGTGQWWVKHSWELDGEGYTNWELLPEADYGEGTWVEGILLEDGITMKIGTLNDTEALWGYNTRTPVFNDGSLSYEVVRWEYQDGQADPKKIWTLEWNYKTKKSAFDNRARKPMNE